MPGSTRDSETARWCAGLPLRAHRPLSPEEAVRVHRCARGHLLRLVAHAAAMALGVGAAILLLEAAVTAAAEHARAPLVASAILTAGLLVPLLGASAARLLRRLLALRADLREGRVEGYLGVVDPEPVDAGQRRLVAEGLLVADRRREQCLEVLPHSNTVLSINGCEAPPQVFATTSELAAAQPFRFATRLPPDLVEVDDDGGLELRRRALTRAETAELARHAHRYRRRFWLTFALASASAAAVATGWRQAVIEGGARHLPAIDASWSWVGWSGALAGLALVGYVGYALWLRVTHRMEADRRLSWVITVRERDAAAGEPRFEILPASRLLWTEGRRPAPWRFDLPA